MNRNTPRDHAACYILTSLVTVCTVTGLAVPTAAPAEPNVEVASAWWPEMENTWVPIGWKDHRCVSTSSTTGR